MRHQTSSWRTICGANSVSVASVHVAAQIYLSRYVSHDGQRQGRPSRAGQVAVIPYADFTYFVLLLYVAVPTVILGVFGRAGWRWALLVTTVMLLVQYHDVLHLGAPFRTRNLARIGVRLVAMADRARLRRRRRARRLAVLRRNRLSVLPLALAKVIPLVSPETQFGFLGISYVTFRALDIVFCLRDGVIARPGPVDLFMFLFFFPTISAGPIDRYRRFAPDWRKTRSRAEFLADLDGAVHHFFRGLLYKFISLR
jgi:Predicted membrane protein involved in D-alanine export